MFADPTSINIRHLFSIPNSPPVPIPKYLSSSISYCSLYKIDLGGLAAFTVCDEDVASLLQSCPGLCEIGLNDCVQITDNSMLALCQFEGRMRVRKLELDRCSNLTDTGLCPALSTLTNLTHLSLNVLPFITHKVIAILSKSCPRLKHLGISDGDALDYANPISLEDVDRDGGGIGGGPLEWLARGCPALHSWDFSACGGVSSDAFVEFARVRRRVEAHKSSSSSNISGNVDDTRGNVIDTASIPIEMTSVIMRSLDALNDIVWDALFVENIVFDDDAYAVHGSGDTRPSSSSLWLDELDISGNMNCSARTVLGSMAMAEVFKRLTKLDISQFVFSPPPSEGGDGGGGGEEEEGGICSRLLARAVGALEMLIVLKMAQVRRRTRDGRILDDVVTDEVCEALGGWCWEADDLYDVSRDPEIHASGQSLRRRRRLRRKNQLVVLDVSENAMITDAGLSVICQQARGSLKDLNVKGCALITDASIQHLFEDDQEGRSSIRRSGGGGGGGAVLRFLNLGLCSLVTDAAVKRMARFCSVKRSMDGDVGLHSLKLSGCFHVTDAAIMAVTEGILTSKSQLSLSSSLSSSLLSPASPTSSLSRSSTCSDTSEEVIGSLRLLCFSGCFRLSNASLCPLLALLPMLESINFYSCFHVNDDTLTCLVRHCKRIQSLVISKCPVSDVGAVAIAKGCPRLHTLYMSFLAPIADSSSLNCGLSDVGVSTLLSLCKSLKLLDVSRCDRLTDNAFIPSSFASSSLLSPVDMEEHINNKNDALSLQVLIVRACSLITFDGLKRLLTRARHLQTMDVTGCARVTTEERELINEMLDNNL